jgi:hypothetical protein
MLRGVYQRGSLTAGSLGLTLPKQLRQPRDVDGDPPRLILRQNLACRASTSVSREYGRRSRQGFCRHARARGIGVVILP